MADVSWTCGACQTTVTASTNAGLGMKVSAHLSSCSGE